MLSMALWQVQGLNKRDALYQYSLIVTERLSGRISLGL